MSKHDDWAQDIFDVLAASPTPMLRDDIMEAIGMIDATSGVPDFQEVNDFHDAKNKLQRTLGLTTVADTITMVGHPDPLKRGKGWEYSLQGDPAHPVSRTYQIAKTRRLFGALMTAYAVARSLKQGTSASTAVGKVAKKVEKATWRLLEDSADALVELGVPAPTLPPAPKP
jgi:FPC/CPF motif-containing protein YcgG